MNFKMVLDWVRRHVFIVVFGAIIIAAPVAGWLIGSSLKDGVMQELQSRKSDIDALTGFESTSITLNIPGREPISVRGVVNKPLLDSYEEVVGALRKDADEVRNAALKHNSKGRDVLMPGVFPKPPESKRQTIHEEFHPEVVRAYENLLRTVRAGMPPAPAQVKEQLVLRSSKFIASVGGGKRSRTDLGPEDRKRYDDDLLKARKGIYTDAAKRYSFYASPDSVGMPRLPANIPSSGLGLDRMFEWNWNFWITEDILRAIAAANEGSPNVLKSPVKRVVDLRVVGLGKAGESNAPAPAAAGAESAPAAMPVDPKSEVQRSYTAGFTGRQTNALYDVREVRLELVIATDALPRLADALAAQNFITITDVRLKPADPFAAARQGFMYGAEPVSEVTLTLEAVQLREWTTRRMPEELKRRLGTAGLATAEGAADGTAPPPSGT